MPHCRHPRTLHCAQSAPVRNCGSRLQSSWHPGHQNHAACGPDAASPPASPRLQNPAGSLRPAAPCRRAILPRCSAAAHSCCRLQGKPDAPASPETPHRPAHPHCRNRKSAHHRAAHCLQCRWRGHDNSSRWSPHRLPAKMPRQPCRPDTCRRYRPRDHFHSASSAYSLQAAAPAPFRVRRTAQYRSNPVGAQCARLQKTVSASWRSRARASGETYHARCVPWQKQPSGKACRSRSRTPTRKARLQPCRYYRPHRYPACCAFVHSVSHLLVRPAPRNCFQLHFQLLCRSHH